MSCRCPQPNESNNPRHAGHCVKCSHLIVKPEWECNDRNLGLFFDRLASCFPAYVRSKQAKDLPRWFFNFYRECSGREKAGRKRFGLAYLGRNNPREAIEEAADLANYMYMETLRRRRLGEDEEEDIALTGAWHAAKAYEAAERMIQHNYKALGDDPEEE